MSGILIVRAQVINSALKQQFDEWYKREHLPDAKRAFGAARAWRAWSDMDAMVHYAFYEFGTVDLARAAAISPQIESLIADFDATWGDGITRTREIVERVQTLHDQ